MSQSLNLFLLTIISLCLTCSLSLARDENIQGITILSDSSFTEPLTEMIRIYSRDKNSTINASFDDPSEQAKKILDGDNADIFISSNTTFMNKLKQKGLVDVFSITNLARNKLALVSSDDRISKTIPTKDNLLKQIIYIHNKSLIVMADPDETTLGTYTKNAISKLEEKYHYSIWNKIKNHLIRSYDSKNTLYLITHGNRSGIVYYTDAYKNKEVNIISLFDEDKSNPIIYQAAVIAGENMSKAREFIEFLKSETASNILKKYGFLPIENIVN